MTDTYRYKMLFVSELRKYKESEVTVTGNSWLSDISCDSLGNLLFDKFKDDIFKYTDNKNREYAVSIIACFVIVVIANRYKNLEEFEESRHLSLFVRNAIDKCCLFDIDTYEGLIQSGLQKVELFSVAIFVLAQLKYTEDLQLNTDDLESLSNVFKAISAENKEYLLKLYREAYLDFGYLLSQQPVYILSKRMQNYVATEH